MIEKGVFSIEEVRDMLDRLEATVRRAKGEIEGDLPRRRRGGLVQEACPGRPGLSDRDQSRVAPARSTK